VFVGTGRESRRRLGVPPQAGSAVPQGIGAGDYEIAFAGRQPSRLLTALLFHCPPETVARQALGAESIQRRRASAPGDIR